MDTQMLINLAFALIGALGGMVISRIYKAQDELRASDKELFEKVHAIENTVAGQYVKRDEFNRSVEQIFTRLDAINLNINVRFDAMNEKLGNKRDKNEPTS